MHAAEQQAHSSQVKEAACGKINSIKEKRRMSREIIGCFLLPSILGVLGIGVKEKLGDKREKRVVFCTFSTYTHLHDVTLFIAYLKGSS